MYRQLQNLLLDSLDREVTFEVRDEFTQERCVYTISSARGLIRSSTDMVRWVMLNSKVRQYAVDD